MTQWDDLMADSDDDSNELDERYIYYERWKERDIYERKMERRERGRER